ncbi:MAG: DUF1684 domain-containing protein [Bacteroidota bacterium]
MNKRFFSALLVLSSLSATAQTSYQSGIDSWHKQRIADLKKENGWLNLAGLLWLQPGKNSFGGGQQAQLKFPAGTIADNAGYFELKENTVWLHTNESTKVQVNGVIKNDVVIFSTDSARPAICSYDHLRWTIIKREDKIGIRLRDLESKELKKFSGIDRFPVDSTFKVTAFLQKPFAPSIPITNVLGQTNEQTTAGKLSFALQGKQYTLDALDEGDELFIIFGDATSGNETYPSGRFLYAKKPGADGYTIVDFNKSYNPPCAFTPYATCPLPPRQNILPVAINAGEKNYGHH